MSRIDASGLYSKNKVLPCRVADRTVKGMVGSTQDSDIRRADERDCSLNEQGKVNKLSHRQPECVYVLRARRLVGIAALAWRYDKWSTSRLISVGMTNAATAL